MINTKKFKAVTDSLYIVDDFSQFNIVEGNRAINDRHKNKIKRAIQSGAYIQPIVVDKNTGGIIDGQHRAEAYKELKESGMNVVALVMLVDSKNVRQDIVTYNNSRKNWVVTDYINNYCAMGNANYKRFKKFLDSHEQLSVSAAAQMIMRTRKPRLSTGRLVCTPESVREADLYYKELSIIAAATNDNMFLKRNVVLAYINLRPAIIKKMVTFDAWVKLLEKEWTPKNTDAYFIYKDAMEELLNA